MITKIMSAMPCNTKSISPRQASPSFGFAKLNDVGRRSADEFGYQHNDFLNNRLFVKQKLFRKAAIAEELKSGKTLMQICEQYGCTNNPSANAAFIESQILSSKGVSALRTVEEAEAADALIRLYDFNYDNPQLSLKSTKALLERISENIQPSDYIKHRGLLDVGADK